MKKREERVRKAKKEKKQRRIRKTTILFIILDLIVAICFFVFYGPYVKFRNTLINTAMVTKTHQWVAYTFYDDDTIKKSLDQGRYIPITDTLDLDQIVIDTKPKKTYENEYDEIILTRTPGNEDYKYIPVKVGKYDAHLVAIYDPSKVKLITSPQFNTGNGAEKVMYMCKRLGGRVCINGGNFADPDGWGSDIPRGYLIKDGKIIWSDHADKANLIGFTNDNKLWLTYSTGRNAINNGMRDALEFGPFLIVNGKKIQSSSAAGGYDRAARVAIGQRKDGVVLMLVTEGVHSNGPNLLEVADTLELYGAFNAANLDGGTSSTLIMDGKLTNHPKNLYGQNIFEGRKVVSGFGLITKK